MDAGPQLEIRLLGRFLLRRDGQEIPARDLGGRLGRTLIRILVTRRGTVVPVDVLAEALWPDRQPADPAANVAVLLSRVRRALEDPKVIAAASGGYLFAAGDCCAVIVRGLSLPEDCPLARIYLRMTWNMTGEMEYFNVG